MKGDLITRADAIALTQAVRQLCRLLEGWQRGTAARAHMHHVKVPADDKISIAQAVQRSGRHPATIRRWAEHDGLGSKVRGRWQISSSLLRLRISVEANASEGAVPKGVNGSFPDEKQIRAAEAFDNASKSGFSQG